VTTPDSGVTAVLLQMQQLAERFGALDNREDEHHRDVSEALTGLGTSVDELRATVTGQGQILASLDGVSDKLAELAAVIEPLLPPEPGPLYHPAPAPRWWARDFSAEDREAALAKLRGWVRDIFRGQYGHLGAKLGACWDRHPLCLIELDWACELWSVLYLRATRTPGVLSSQAEFGTRILPALAEQLATETAGCRHQRPQVAANGWAGAR
jgi:hypothetical protein